MQTATKIYKKLQENGESTYLLRSILYLLELDQEAYMPQNGIDIRAKQNQLISEIRHKIATNAKVKKALAALCDLKTGHVTASELGEEEKASVREMLRDYQHDTKLSSTFIKKFSDATTQSLQAWKKAKKENDFRSFASHLKKIVSLSQKKAELLGYHAHPYDALLDEYEPKMTVAKLDHLFSDLKEKIVLLMRRRKEKKLGVDDSYLTTHFYPLAKQKELSIKIIEEMGLAKENYHLAETAHPFCLPASPDDLRMTTHYYAEDFRKSFFATMHECGHALYEHGLPKQYIGTPLAEAASFGVHESQSRFWECFIGHSHPFWRFQYPRFKEAFPDTFQNVSLDHFVRSINNVNPSFIRIFADEVTYNLHIILRYELEKGLIEGSINVKEIPKLWNQKMQEMFGIKPSTDSEGCLQDIHWSLGYFGYFPSYSLGNLYAGAIYQKFIKTYSDWEHRIASGDLKFIKEFLREKIHQHGRRYAPDELIEKAIGGPFTINPYISYLEGKFL